MRRMTGLAAFGLLALASCSDEPAVIEEQADDAQSEAAGEVLGGTISDDMLPLDQLRSQSPPAASDPATSGSASSEQPDAAPAADQSVEAAPEPGAAAPALPSEDTAPIVAPPLPAAPGAPTPAPPREPPAE
ncbi:MAG: hypothetical protein AAF707_02660 [Pseudomonadota bacterium]